MNHLYLLYFLLTCATGLVSLSIAGFVYTKTREKLIKDYLLFYTVFSLLVVSEAFIVYVQANLPDFNTDILRFYLAPIGYAMLFAATAFIHGILDIPHAKIKNAIVGGIALLITIQHFIIGVVATSSANTGKSLNLEWWVYFVYTVAATSVLYVVIVGIVHGRRLEDSPRKLLMQKGGFFSWLAIPATFADTFWHDKIPFRLFPIFYCFLSISFTHHFLKYSLHHVGPVPAEEPGATSQKTPPQAR